MIEIKLMQNDISESNNHIITIGILMNVTLCTKVICIMPNATLGMTSTTQAINSVFRLPFLFSIPIPNAAYSPVSCLLSMSSDRDARSMDVSVSAYVLCSLIA